MPAVLCIRRVSQESDSPLGGEKVSTWGMRFGKFGVAGLAITGFVLEWETGNVELGTGWVDQAYGFHIYRGRSAIIGRYVNWMRADNRLTFYGGHRISKLISHLEFQGHNKWEVVFSLSSIVLNKLINFWLFANNSEVDPVHSKGIHLDLASNGEVNLTKEPGCLVLGSSYWTPDCNEHFLKIERTSDNGQEDWHILLDNVEIINTTLNNTEQVGRYVGFNCDERTMVTALMLSQE
jgi:hypothetical protein